MRGKRGKKPFPRLQILARNESGLIDGNFRADNVLHFNLNFNSCP
jgi:hypothetical protein